MNYMISTIFAMFSFLVIVFFIKHFMIKFSFEFKANCIITPIFLVSDTCLTTITTIWIANLTIIWLN